MTDGDDILRQRARSLATPSVATHELAPADTLHLLLVLVDGERLGIPLDRIAAIARAVEPAPLPRAVAPVCGVAVWRGRPLTVLTLGAGPPEIGPDSRFVVLGDARRADVALLVDAVDDVRAVARESLTPSGPSTRAVATIGITDDAVLVLDPASLVRERRDATHTFPDSSRTA